VHAVTFVPTRYVLATVHFVPAWTLLLLLAAQPAYRPAATTEATRQGAEYLVQRAGASWTYQLERGRGQVTIASFSDWRAAFSFSLGRRTGSGRWWVREGAWMERSSARGDVEAVVLPARVSQGSHWAGPASLERGGARPAQFEVMALDATVELPGGGSAEGCLAVLETPEGSGQPWTHYYQPNVGKVAVRSPEGWVLRLLRFRAGGGHRE
jgi:hypothetical protein